MLRLPGISSRIAAPTNKALTKIAQARVENEAARAVARHANALAVDGTDIYLWKRSNAGLICTCRKPLAGLQATPLYSSPEAIREPLISQGSSAIGGIANADDIDFKVMPRVSKDDEGFDYDPNMPDELRKSVDIYSDGIGDRHAEQDAYFETENEISDQQLATMLNEGAAVYGGDKTVCGICFGTQRTHGYDLATGKRLLLDASGEVRYTLINANMVENTYPKQFSINSNGYIVWLVDLPSYTNGWLNFTIRDNLAPASNLVLEFFYYNQWLPLTVTNISQSEGSDRTQTPIRVRQADNSGLSLATLTHVELIYATRKPLLGQMPPLNYMTNYEVDQPLITTEFEILADIDDIPRESVFQDAKFKYLWKVIDVTPKMTALGQVFSLNLTARRIQQSELLYALKVIFDPLVTVNYRGLELEEGGLLADNIYGQDNNVESLKFTIGGN